MKNSLFILRKCSRLSSCIQPVSNRFYIRLFRKLRTPNGFLLAPGLVAILFAAWVMFLQPSLTFRFKDFEFLAILVYLSSWLYGIPCHLILKTTSSRQLWHYAVAGALGGVLASAAFAIYPPFVGSRVFHFYRWISFAIFGAFGASVFWLLVLWHRRGKS